MQPRNGIQTLDTTRPTFDPHLDIATVVFSHVQCVKTRHSLALVSKLWRDASKPAAAYPRTFDFDGFPDMDAITRRLTRVLDLVDNDEALSLPYERVVGFLGEAGRLGLLGDYAASRGSLRLLKWERVNDRVWSVHTCSQAAGNGQLPALQYLHENGCPWDEYTCTSAAHYGHLPALQYLHENGCPWNSNTCTAAAISGHLPTLQYLHENGCPWDEYTCYFATLFNRWDCLQYAVDNKCPEWEIYAKRHAEHLR